MKRHELERRLRMAGCYLKREGASHSLWINPKNGVVEASRSGMLKGGLRKGKNSIVISITRTDRDAASPPQVTIRRVLEDRKTEEVFTFEPKGNVEGTHALAFTID
jgi:hypothetical protein